MIKFETILNYAIYKLLLNFANHAEISIQKFFVPRKNVFMNKETDAIVFCTPCHCLLHFGMPLSLARLVIAFGAPACHCLLHAMPLPLARRHAIVFCTLCHCFWRAGMPLSLASLIFSDALYFQGDFQSSTWNMKCSFRSEYSKHFFPK